MADHITIGDTPPRAQYTANGAQTDFTYPFPVFDETDLRVYVDDALQTLATHYSVTGAGDSAGGTVSFLAAPADGAVVTLLRKIVIQRSTDFQESGEFRAKVINDELDKRVAVEQQLADALDRSLKQPETDPAGDLTIPAKADRAGRTLAFDAASGNPVAGPTASDVTNAAGYATQVAADKATIEALLADLGVPAVPTFTKDVDGTDVANGYVDLAGFDPSHQANIGCAVDGVVQEPALDFTAADNEGTWRLTWDGASGFAPVVGQRLHLWRRGGAYASEGGGGAAAWGAITGTLANQTDLQSALNVKAADTHTHSESDITDLGDYEPAFSKNSAFNKNFAGTGAAATVARSDHGHDIGDMNDVNLTGLANGDVLKYSSGSGTWVPAADDAGGGGADLWSAIATDNGTSPVPDSTTDTLTLAGGAGIATTGDSAADRVTFDLALAGLTVKTTPVDADLVALADSGDSDNAKGLTWANIKVALKSYFDGLYLALTGGSLTGNLNFQDNHLIRPFLKDYASVVVDEGTQATTVAVDFQDGNVARATLNGTGLSVTIGNWPTGEGIMRMYLTQQGGGDTVTTWPVDKWIGGSAPILGTSAGDIDVIVISSPDGGTTRVGTHVGTAN